MGLGGGESERKEETSTTDVTTAQVPTCRCAECSAGHQRAGMCRHGGGAPARHRFPAGGERDRARRERVPGRQGPSRAAGPLRGRRWGRPRAAGRLATREGQSSHRGRQPRRPRAARREIGTTRATRVGRAMRRGFDRVRVNEFRRAPHNRATIRRGWRQSPRTSKLRCCLPGHQKRRASRVQIKRVCHPSSPNFAVPLWQLAADSSVGDGRAVGLQRGWAHRARGGGLPAGRP